MSCDGGGVCTVGCGACAEAHVGQGFEIDPAPTCPLCRYYAWTSGMGGLVGDAYGLSHHPSCEVVAPRATLGPAAAPRAVVGGVVGAAVSHEEARQILRRAWQLVHDRSPTESELAYAQAVAWLETGYGRAGQFAALADRGIFNWGAIQRARNPDGSCPQGTTPGIDAGNPRCFYAFPSDLEAARRYLWELTKNPARSNRVAATLRAMASGSPEDVASALKVAPAWYEAPVATYARAVRNALGATGANALLAAGQVASSAASTVASSPLGGLAAAAALGAGAWWLASRGARR